jgi:hypothetical protein
MNINTERIKSYYDTMRTHQIEKRKQQLNLEQRRVEYDLKMAEQQRIAINRELNFIGQNIDTYA